MRPFWHTIAIGCVPIYGLFRFHAHMRTIRETALLVGRRPSLSPATCVAMFFCSVYLCNGLLSRVTPRNSGDEMGLTLLGIFGSLLSASVIIWAQQELNATWLHLDKARKPYLPSPVEWVMLVGGVGLWAYRTSNWLPR